MPAQRTTGSLVSAICARYGEAGLKVKCNGEVRVTVPLAASTLATSARSLTERLSTRLKYWQSPSSTVASST